MGSAARWDAVRARLNALTAGGAGRPSPQQVDELLSVRARELAAPLEADAAAGEQRDHLIVVIAGSRFALPADQVDSVLSPRHVTSLPGTPAFVLGLTHHRGDIVSVLDAGRLLSVPAESPADESILVLLRHAEMRFALAVADVVGVETVAIEDIQTVPAGSAWSDTYVAGISVGGLIVVDAVSMLNDGSLVVCHPAHPGQEEQTL